MFGKNFYSGGTYFIQSIAVFGSFHGKKCFRLNLEASEYLQLQSRPILYLLKYVLQSAVRHSLQKIIIFRNFCGLLHTADTENIIQ